MGASSKLSLGLCRRGKDDSIGSAKDIQRVIDEAHERVYGESRLARIERLSPIGDGSEEPDWDAFDAPTFERKST